ncbi:MAG: EAL domain-containing protein [Agarilytica sp.]
MQNLIVLSLQMKLNPLKHVRVFLVAPFLASILVFLAVIYWGMNRQYSTEVSTLAHSYDGQLSKSFVDALEVEAEHLQAFIYLIQKNPVLDELFLQRDRGALVNQTEALFLDLKRENRVTHFYFIDPSGEVFLRVHSPQKYGDQIKRKTFAEAKKTGEIASGIEFGTLGQFVLRVVLPWKVDGKIVGYIEFGEEIEHILDALAYNNNLDLVLAVGKDFIVDQGLLESDYFKTRKVDVNKKDKELVVYQTLETISSELRESISNFPEQGPRFVLEGSKSFLFSQVPVADFAGEQVGSLSYMVDETEMIDQQKSIVRDLGILVCGFGLLICAFYFIYSGFLREYLVEVFGRLQVEISDRKVAEKSLMENKSLLEEMVKERDISLDKSRQRYKTLFEKSADALFLLEEKCFVDCNQATLDLFGYSSNEELYQLKPYEVSPECQPDGQTSIEKSELMVMTAIDKGSHRFEWVHKKRTGETFPAEVLLTAISHNDKPLVHAVVRDITDRKKAAEEIEFQALYDSLTSLPNRRLLFDRLNQSLVAAREHNYVNALLFVDIDRFKTINDTLGHSVGDALLIESANRIQNCLTREDTASRFGGDEFVVLLRHIGENKESGSFNAEKVASRVMAALSEPSYIQEQEFHITASVGIALFPGQEKNVDDIIKHADTAMYSAKESGRNRIAFYLADMHEKVIHRLTLERELRKIVKAKKLEVYYQPQLNLQGDVIAVEALVRWRHPDMGFISPEEFIPIAEETGIIFDLGDFVLNQAISDIVGLNKKLGTNIGIAINISQKQFDKDDFLNEIESYVKNYQLAKHLLTLEVTEGLAINNLNTTVERFEALRHLGVRLSLDDFGTGYSSLSHLKRLPLDELKIDKGFVFDVLDDPQDAQLVKTIISIAHQFGLSAVAEGVEGEKEREFLAEQGCDILQGYLYSRPVPIDELEVFIVGKLAIG